MLTASTPELDLLEAQLALLAARELDEVGNECRERVELGRRFGERALRLVLGKLPFLQQVHVRARCGQRRA